LQLTIGRLASFIVFAAAFAGPPPASAVPCAPGSASVDGEEPCTPCASGSFASMPGSTSCLACPVGSYASGEGSIACVLCEPGSYAGEPGSAACSPCAAGSYVEFAGAPSCLLCPPGSASPVVGAGSASACTLCPSGAIAPAAGASECQGCAPGSFASESGSIACTPCEPGRFTNVFASPVCEACPAGSVAPQPGATACNACPRNAYVPNAGQTQCLACGCDDGISCTHDGCDAMTGACSAPPVPGCSEIEVAFSGSVSAVDVALAGAAQIGDAVEGSFRFDPEAPDATPLDATYGDYPSAVTGLEVSIGSGPALAASSPGGRVRVESNGVSGDVLSFEAFSADGLTGPAIASLPDGAPGSFVLRLADPGATALGSDALPFAAPVFSSFPNRTAYLAVESASAGTVYVDAVIDAPEPGREAALAAALAALALRHGMRRRARQAPPR
jgi:hypothetical protein